jgi:anthranilate synthase component 1
MDRSSIQRLALSGDPGDRLLALHRGFPSRYPVLLESAAHGTAQGRHTLLLARPGDRIDASTLPGGAGFLQALDAWWGRERRTRQDGRVPFAGGWFLFLGYELAGEVEPSLRLPAAPEGEGRVAWRMHAAVVHDHATSETYACAEDGEEGFCEQVRRDLLEVPDTGVPPLGQVTVIEDEPEDFLLAVRRARELIAAGDVYQVNLSRGWKAALEPGVPAADLYARLRRSNPGPFAGVACLGDTSIISSSPERLASVRGAQIETRPIAGTRPRLPGSDAPSIDELINHPKERAEHIMLIDLERNDLGRLCEAGTVAVDELMSVETYAHVHHIVSNVTGRLRPGVTPGQVVRALFPGGTITGCPKVRCMQIIGDLEARGRGAYTGSMGYLGLDGDMDLNILIRTLTLRHGVAMLRTGAGIVADSDPDRELEETRAKARGVLLALEGGA